MLQYNTVKMVSLSDWDKLVKDTYGKPYSFQQQDGCKDRGTYRLVVPVEYADEIDLGMPKDIPFKINGDEMGVRFSTWLNISVEDINKKYPEDYPNANRLFWDRNFYPDIEVVANDLYNKGLIEKGEYLIDID